MWNHAAHHPFRVGQSSVLYTGTCGHAFEALQQSTQKASVEAALWRCHHGAARESQRLSHHGNDHTTRLVSVVHLLLLLAWSPTLALVVTQETAAAAADIVCATGGEMLGPGRECGCRQATSSPGSVCIFKSTLSSEPDTLGRAPTHSATRTASHKHVANVCQCVNSKVFVCGAGFNQGRPPLDPPRFLGLTL